MVLGIKLSCPKKITLKPLSIIAWHYWLGTASLKKNTFRVNPEFFQQVSVELLEILSGRILIHNC